MSLDVSDRSEPAFMATYSPLGWHERAYHLALDGSERMFISHRKHGWITYDIRNPWQASAGEFTTLSGASGLAYEDDVLFVATHTDLSTLTMSLLLFRNSSTSSGWGIRGGCLFMKTIYTSLITHKVLLSLIGNPLSNFQCVTELWGAEAYKMWFFMMTLPTVLQEDWGVDVFDVSSPDSPQWIGNIPTSYPAIELAVDNEVLWVASQQDVIAIDISNPYDPIIQNTEKTASGRWPSMRKTDMLLWPIGGICRFWRYSQRCRVEIFILLPNKCTSMRTIRCRLPF